MNRDDLFYVCSMIEYVARKTKNRPADIVKCISDAQLRRQLNAAEVNHCLSFEQVSDEWIEDFNILTGDYDNIESCKYEVPSYLAIGRVYESLISAVSPRDKEIETLRAVFASFISSEISDYNTSVYYSNPDYLRASYEEGKLLA